MGGAFTTMTDETYGCELVTNPLDRDGYGRIGRRLAHLVAWEDANGPIPEGMFVDHGCRRRNCRALHHLELVTKSENELRKSWKYRARRTHCPKGHALAVNRVLTPEGGIVCRACNREAKGLNT